MTCFAREDSGEYSSCSCCGTDRGDYSQGRMLIEYDDGTKVDSCSMHCTAAEFAAHREKALKRLQVSDYDTQKLINAKDAYWVIGGSKTGVMTNRAKWAFEKKENADKFIKESGGEPGTFDMAMRATFEDMYADIRMINQKNKTINKKDDITSFPECRYCGMDRHEYSHSRALVEYSDGTAAGVCSIHCAAIDLALNMNKTLKAVMIADYNSRKLISAEKAVWVMGGTKCGVMTIRAKWAFETEKGAREFIKNNVGRLSTFDEVMKATFEDTYEIMR
jgi:copper chaperone NosL